MTQEMSVQLQTQTGTVPIRNNKVCSKQDGTCADDSYILLFISKGDQEVDNDSDIIVHMAVDVVCDDDCVSAYVCMYSPLSEQALASEYAEPSPPGRHPPHSHFYSDQWW